MLQKIKYPKTSVFIQVFFKCHYDYDPANDNLIPCKEAGLRFETGDILQIVNQDDVNWWQVKSKSNLCFASLYSCTKAKMHFKLKITLKTAICVCFGKSWTFSLCVLHRLVMLRVVAQDWSQVRCWRRRGKHL